MIETRCNHCHSLFRVDAGRVGSKTMCPKCSKPFVVAAVVTAHESPRASGAAVKVEQWQVKSPDGSQFGPATKQQLDAWVSDGRVTADFQLLRVGDDQWTWAEEIYPELAPAEFPVAFDLAPPAHPTALPIAGEAKHRPRFNPRTYPAMTVVMWVCYVLAGIFTVSLILTLVLLGMGAGLGIAESTESDQISAMSAATAMAAAMTILGHGICILSCVYAAEMIKIVQDIQLNTQEAAHFARTAG